MDHLICPVDEMATTVELPKITDLRGSLTLVEGVEHLPFDIKRIYYLYDVPRGKSRGGHVHHELKQMLIAISGSFKVSIDNGHERRTVRCDRPDHGLVINPMVWRELSEFSDGAICLVLASMHYDESDYILDYDTFINTVRWCCDE